MMSLKQGDYVVATKYRDGDPGDHFCIGFYQGCYDHFGQIRHLVADREGKNFRANGFRRVAKVSASRGHWMVEHLSMIEKMGLSVWRWYRMKLPQ